MRYSSPGGKSRLSGLHRLDDLPRRRDGIGAGPLEDAHADGSLAVEIGVGGVVLRAIFDARHVLHAHEPPVARRAHDHLPELARILEAPLRRHHELEGVVGRRRLLAEGAARHLDVLLADRGDDVAGRHAVGGELVRIEPDAEGILPLAEDGDVADALLAEQDVADAGPGVAGDVELIEGVVRREHMHDHHQVGRALAGGNPEAADLLGQARLGDGDAVLHEDLRVVEVGAEPERDGQGQSAVAGRIRRHVEHVVDAVDLLLERRRHRGGDRLGIGAGIGGAHDDGRRGDLRILGGGQVEVGDAADEQDQERQHGREDRPVDEEVGKAHRLLSVSRPWARAFRARVRHHCTFGRAGSRSDGELVP